MNLAEFIEYLDKASCYDVIAKSVTLSDGVIHILVENEDELNER